MKTEFLVGKALRPRGLKGELRFELYTSDPTRFCSVQQFKLGDTAFNVEKISVEGDFAYIKFAGINTVEEAEKYRGKNLYANRSELPKLKGDKVYIADIIGSDVIVDGDNIGELVDVLQYGSADVYVVKLLDKTGTVNFPALKEVVRSYDVEKGEIIIDGRFFDRVAVYNN
ncbi:MAG: 16S rRNA processing protein RimM [Clostridia bacterium]|nr:16S rRNA processing protein RimM [Clostridia bacterium]